MVTSNFPGLGRYAALGSILAARTNALASQNQAGTLPPYINPQVASPDAPVMGPSAEADTPGMPNQPITPTPMSAGQAPELPQAPGQITMPPMPVSSMIRDAAPKNTMANQMHTANQRYRGMV